MTRPRSRPIADEYPSKRDAEGRRLCAFCGEILKGRRRRWCSEACETEAYIRCNPGIARAYVHRRDHGVCASCGLDTTRLRTLLRDLERLLPRWDGRLYAVGTQQPLPRFSAISRTTVALWSHALVAAIRPDLAWAWRQRHRHLWEADHIVSVEDGGGLCGLDGYQTLCVRCHQIKSAQERRERARRGTALEATASDRASRTRALERSESRV